MRNYDWGEVFAWLDYADTVAQQDQPRQADPTVKYYDENQAQRLLEQRRAADQAERLAQGVDPAPRIPTNDPPLGENYAFKLGLKVYTRITAALFKRHKIAAAYLYWILQHRAADHGEKFTVAELRAYLAELGIAWSERRIRDALNQGRDLLWITAHRDRADRRAWVYAMRSKERVMLALGIGDPGSRVTIADHAWRVQDIRDWRAFLWGAFVENHPGNGEAARETLARDFGVSRRTSITYDKQTGNTVTHQITHALKPGKRDHEKWFEIGQHQTSYHWFGVERWRTRKRGYARVWYCWQDVNRYASAETRLSTSHRRGFLMVGTQALKAENARISAKIDGRPNDQGSSSEQGKSARQFTDFARAGEYQRQHPQRPVKLFDAIPRRIVPAVEGMAWRFGYSPAVVGGIQA